MKKIILKKVTVKGFKGYKDERTYTLNECENILVGGNAKGKSTLADAISWALTGKLFEGSKSENTLMNINSKKAIVEIAFDNENGENIITRSITPSSSAIIKLNDKKISQKKLSEIIDENTFLMTFNPLNFLAKKPTEARNVIMSVVDGVITDDIVLNNLTESERLHLKGINLEDDSSKNIRKIISNLENDLMIKEAMLDKSKKELESIVIPNCSENPSNTKDIELKKAEIEKLKDLLRISQSDFNELTKKHLSISEEISQKTSEGLHEIELKIVELKECERAIIVEGKTLKAKEYSLKNNFELEKEIVEMDSNIKSLTHENDIYKEAIRSIREKYALKEGSSCPVCKQRIDKKVVSTLKKIEENESKSFIEKGVKNKNKIDELKSKVDTILQDLKKLEVEENKNKETFEKNKVKQLNILRKKLIDTQAQIKKLEDKREVLKDKIETNLANLNKEKDILKDKIKEVEKKTVECKVKIEEVSKDLNLLEVENKKQEDTIRNIEILKSKKEKLTLDIEILEKEVGKINLDIKNDKITLLSITNFRETKIRLIEKAISSHLNKVSFELEKINKDSGEIKGCFIVKYDKKELSCCSFSEVVKAGIEIGRMLRNSLSLEYPLFIDNSESLLDIDTKDIQTIRTIVVDIDNILQVDKSTLNNMVVASAKVLKNNI